MTSRVNILISNGIEIFFYKSKLDFSRSVCLIFGARFFDTSKNGGAEVFLAKGIDVILIYDGRNEWYQNFNNNHISAINNIILNGQYLDVIGYGISMGGYAAIQFSKLFKINRVLSFSPQFSIEIEEDTRHYKISQEIKMMYRIDINSLWKNCRYTIISDHEYKLDKLHTDKFIKLIHDESVVFYNCKHTGHSTVRCFLEQGILKNVVNKFIDNEFIGLDYLKTNRSNSPTYLGFLAAAVLRHNKPHISKLILENGLRMYPENFFLLKQLGLLYKGIREFEKGCEILLKVHKHDVNDCDTCIQLSICFDGINHVHEAIDYAKKAIKIDSGREWYHRHLDRLILRLKTNAFVNS